MIRLAACCRLLAGWFVGRQLYVLVLSREEGRLDDMLSGHWLACGKRSVGRFASGLLSRLGFNINRYSKQFSFPCAIGRVWYSREACTDAATTTPAWIRHFLPIRGTAFHLMACPGFVKATNFAIARNLL